MTDNDLEANLGANSKEQAFPEGFLTSQERTSTAYLDGLRGLAALIVYFSHSIPWWYGAEGLIEHGWGYHSEHMFATFPFIRSFFTGGAAAVTIFFVLSGYVLSISPLRKLKDRPVDETRRYLVAAALRRPVRLFLPVAAISLVFALCMQTPFRAIRPLEWPESQPTLVAELSKWLQEFGWTINIFAKHGQFDHWFRYDPPAWTMAAELKGSLLVYGLLGLTSTFAPRHRLYTSALTGICLLLIYQWELACFMMGLVLAILDMERIGFSKAKSHGLRDFVNHLAFFLGWYILGQPHGKREPEISYNTPGWYWMTHYFTPPNYYNNEFWRFWNVIGATMLIFAVLRICWIQTLFSRPTLRYLGKISFSLYLLHIYIIWTIGDRISRIFGVRRQNIDTPFDNMLPIPDIGPTGFSLGLLCWQAFLLPLSLSLASLATRRMDEPSVRLSKFIASKLGFYN